MYSPSIQRLIDLFSKFPTVGPRTAARFVFYLMKVKKEKIEEIINSISDLKKNVKICSFCFNPFEGEGEICPICQDQTRNRHLLCIVANETDLMAIEKTKKYGGLYFILGGTVSTVKKADIKKLRIKQLEEKIKNQPKIKEIIIATNPTSEGKTTSLYLERLLNPFNKKITRLGQGLPMGGELEYADQETLGSALDNRR